MKNLYYTLLVAVTSLASVTTASAQGSDSGGNNFLNAGTGGSIGSAAENALTFIDSVVIPFILSIGFLVFVWGMFKYFIQGGANDEAKESGKSLIMYAIAGYVVILAFWGIVNILSNGIGLEETLDDTPSVKVD